jgi:hypothetical protein
MWPMAVTAQLPQVNSKRRRASISQAARRCCDVLKSMLQAYVSSISNILEVCYNCLQMNVAKVDHMLQWLYTYVAKVYSQFFICVFDVLLQVCLSEYCIFFTHML